MGLVNKSDYIYAKLLDKASEISEQLIEVDDKEIIRLGLESQDILTVSIDHIEWENTESLETYQGTKVTLPKINIYWDDETITQASINYTMIDNVSYYLEAGNYELRAIYKDFTSTNILPITVIEKLLVSIEWENTNPITTQQNHRAYIPYIKLNYNDGKFKRLSSQSPGVTLSDSEYYLELGEKTLTATYKEFTTNELTINVIEEEIIDENTHDYSQDYLTIESLEDNNILNWNAHSNSFAKTIYISNDNGLTWNSYTAHSFSNQNIILNKNDKIIVKGENISYTDSSRAYENYFSSTKTFNIYGNIMSLIYGDNFINKFNLSDSYTFYKLFQKCNIISAENLILPATTLTHSCYCNMFEGCVLLTKAPKILPATILITGCYCNMFEGCTSLVKAPELPAQTLAYQSYGWMFCLCSSLSYIKCLAVDLTAVGCLANWVGNVSSTGIFIKNKNTNMWDRGEAGIPQGWTVQEIDPDTGEIVNEYINE